jgi:multimeric flavodoxin WrbA
MCPKVLGIAGSPVKNGNTEILIREALNAAKKENVETELISLANKKIEPCNLQACKNTCGKGKECQLKTMQKVSLKKWFMLTL